MSESSLPGLSLPEQLRHSWTSPFDLSASGPQAHPRSPFFAELVGLEERKSSVVLRLSRAGLEHPTTSSELEKVRWSFLLANLGAASEAPLREWLASLAKEPLKVGERKVELALDGDQALYLIGKARPKFWPFS